MICEVWLKSVSVGENRIELNQDTVVCVVGPNSSGKSSLLSSIVAEATGNRQLEKKSSLSSLEIHHNIDTDGIEKTVKDKVTIAANNLASWLSGRINVGNNPREWFARWADQTNKQKEPYSIFISLIDARNRLSSVQAANHIDPDKEAPQHPSNILYFDRDKESRLSEVAKELFGIEVALNPGHGRSITLHVGSVDETLFKGNRTQEYANEVAKLPQLTTQGDGVQAALGLVSTVLAAEYQTVLIDEPDLYLHPPQAFSLARVLVRRRPKSQFFLATHSSRFVQGLVDEAGDRLRLLRLDRSEKDSKVSVVNVDVFEEIANSPLLKFTGIVEALFFKKLVFCENPADCLLFQGALSAMGALGLDEEVHWIGVYGKNNFPKFVKVARSLAIEPIVVADFDLISPEGDSYKKALVPMLEAFGVPVAKVLDCLESRIFPMVENNATLSWHALKKNGVEALRPYRDVYVAVDELLGLLEGAGIILIREGESESLHSPRLEPHGEAFVSQTLSMDIPRARELEPLRRFTEQLAKKLGLRRKVAAA